MAIEPKPCPFCGSTIVKVHEGSTFRWALAVCENCGASGPEIRVSDITAVTISDADKAEAIEAWNTRAGGSDER